MTTPQLEAAAELLKALAHATRLSILAALVDGERSVGDLEHTTGIAQPTLSQQLAVLRNAALVGTRREAKQVFYHINHVRVEDVSALLDAFADAGTVPRSNGDTLGRPRGGTAAMFARIA